MLKPVPLANSLALTTALLYGTIWVIAALLPSIFALIFNAQFLGADVASLYAGQSLTGTIINLIIVSATAWIFGYVWGYLYNRLEK